VTALHTDIIYIIQQNIEVLAVILIFYFII